MKLKPFLKWAGGKTWLVKYSDIQFPKFTGRYIEPFLGGGAVFFHLKPSSALLADANTRLIETYQAIRDDWESVVRQLELYQLQHSKEFYYFQRSQQHESTPSRAAQFLYLNRACFNGLYRENSRGQFNVPKGTATKIIRSTDNFAAISAALANATLKSQDFADSVNSSRQGDLVFLDPPYTVAHNENGFVNYNQKIFSWADQVRLRDCVQAAVRRGVSVVMTNANHDSIAELYRKLAAPTILPRASTISALKNGRGKSTEAVYIF